MAKNHLTGTVRAPAYFGPLGNEPVDNVISGELHGDGTNISNVARVTSNGTNDYMLTVGASAQSLVGEPNLQFNGSRLLINGNLTASAINLPSLSQGTAATSSFLALDSNNNIVLTTSVGDGGGSAQGPNNSLQFSVGSGNTSGSQNLTFASNTLFVTGNVVVSGNVQAHTFDIIQTNLVEINSSGSTSFGNSVDDVHKFQGKHLELDSGLVVKRIRISSSQTIAINNYYVGVDSFTPSASVTVTLPDAATLQNGQVYVIKDEGGKADLYNVLIKASGSQLIDNQNQVVLESPHASLTLYCDGASKFYIG
jgi:hypothetical protein